MRSAETVTFAGAGIDRAAWLRTRPEALASRAGEPAARILPVVQVVPEPWAGLLASSLVNRTDQGENEAFASWALQVATAHHAPELRSPSSSTWLIPAPAASSRWSSPA